jgi:hypothetical protein
MQVSLKPRMKLRYKIGRIATAVGFALVVGSFADGPASADNRNGGDRDRGGAQHRDNDNRGYRGGDRGQVYAAQPDYNYYAPEPNYYSAPDPYYYGTGPGYEAPPQGVNLFFGL